MSLTLTEVRRIASDIAREQSAGLEVLAATSGEGEPTYAEIILTVTGCHTEPCLLVVGVSRSDSARECGDAVRAQLQRHLTGQRLPTLHR